MDLERTEHLRLCPTRADGADPLIAHEIAPATCQERQRRHYHKCYTCAHRNAAEVNGRSTAPPAVLIARELLPPREAPAANR
ncbi:MAG: hypothetical protein AB1726_01760 [Planctomycetota bacterium]